MSDCFARGEGPDLFFKRMRKSPTIELPIHLDVNVPDREAEVNRIIGLGAKLVETKTSEAGELKENFTVLRDPMETRSASSDQRGSRPDSVLRPAPWADHRLSLEHVVHFQATG
jgi:hypothetical protein